MAALLVLVELTPISAADNMRWNRAKAKQNRCTCSLFEHPPDVTEMISPQADRNTSLPSSPS